MYDELVKLIKESNNIVFFGGAGVSTESHIPDFRSEDGLYKAKTKYGYSPETLISHSFFQRHTDKFYEYYKENLIYLDAKPNDAGYDVLYFRNNSTKSRENSVGIDLVTKNVYYVIPKNK